MRPGRLIAVVGPSGAGKDSVMAGMKQARPDLRLVRRAVTRAPDLGGEDYEAMTPEAFARAVEAGAFCVHWSAHGLSYGIPADVLDDLRAGVDCLANFSRRALPQAAAVFPAMTVLHVTASPETLARRLAGRGRESRDEIAARLSRAGLPLPPGLPVIRVSNDGPLEDTVARALGALQPARA
jgi:ribose 1,5-bisphosphokinase